LFAGSAWADYTDGVIASRKISLETGIHIWRKSAWLEDSFLSEIQLGDIYGKEDGDNKFYDPVESYVWYFLASKSGRLDEHIDDGFARRVIATDYHRAMAQQQKLILLMNADQRREARNRIVYILSCRGAEGFLELGRIHTTGAANSGPNERESWTESPSTYYAMSDMARSRSSFSDRASREFEEGEAAEARRMMGVSSSSVIVPNDGEALTYFHIADNMGHPLAGEYLRGLDRGVRNARGLGGRIADQAAQRAHYWSPPFEFYPAGEGNSGVPLTDECYMDLDRQRALLEAATKLPPRDVERALYFLGWTPRTGGPARFQLTLNDAPTGRLTAAESVRAIQTAAIRGDAASQNALGVMYAHGIGVITNFLRAEYWFQKAGDQRYGAALYHLGVLYKAGPDGIHQDLSKANDFFTASALAGFRPTMNQLGDLLAAASRTRRVP
ncbi:MAG TPA: tetratricopeptide repeat protein, partial [Rhizomicrobium sp.]